MISLRLALPGDALAIAVLLDTCFGPARHNRTAYRLRDGVLPCSGLSFVADDGGRIAGSVQLWQIELADDGGRGHPLLLLGPLAVAPADRGSGLGGALMHAALAASDATGALPVTLIGDSPYYARFGFDAAATRGWCLPGPVDRARLLLRGGAALPARGTLGPPRRALPLAA